MFNASIICSYCVFLELLCKIYYILYVVNYIISRLHKNNFWMFVHIQLGKYTRSFLLDKVVLVFIFESCLKGNFIFFTFVTLPPYCNWCFFSLLNYLPRIIFNNASEDQYISLICFAIMADTLGISLLHNQISPYWLF